MCCDSVISTGSVSLRISTWATYTPRSFLGFCNNTNRCRPLARKTISSSLSRDEDARISLVVPIVVKEIVHPW